MDGLMPIAEKSKCSIWGGKKCVSMSFDGGFCPTFLWRESSYWLSMQEFIKLMLRDKN